MVSSGYTSPQNAHWKAAVWPSGALGEPEAPVFRPPTLYVEAAGSLSPLQPLPVSLRPSAPGGMRGQVTPTSGQSSGQSHWDLAHWSRGDPSSFLPLVQPQNCSIAVTLRVQTVGPWEGTAPMLPVWP